MPRKTKRKTPPYPRLNIVEWLRGNEVRLFFSTGRVVDLALPVKSARHACIVDRGMGLDPGDGLEWSAPSLAEHPRARVVRRSIQ